MRNSDEEKLRRLVSEMLEEDDDERRSVLADSVLEMDPNNGLARYAKWQSIKDEESMTDTTLLREAAALLRPDIENPDEYDGDGDMLYSIYLSILSDLASYSYLIGDRSGAFEAASEFMKLDRDGGAIGRTVYFASLAERGDFKKLLSAVEDDICETPSGEYCRAIAAFETAGSGNEAADYLANAISLDPELPYYILELRSIEEDLSDDGDDYAGEFVLIVMILSELWSETGDRLAFFSAVAFAFGYLTRRMDDSGDLTMLEQTYRDAGCLEDMREARDILDAMLAGGREQREVDDEALSMLQEAGYFGLV
ncbi:MAG: hypothetical protein LBB28_06185 [Synergistaceae bacterium]|jgi:tetratricopeptide (TPR) repeat protein|nr:hypothetical protein [Synergistaceae bacterium]